MPNYKDGRTLKIYRCKDCKKEIVFRAIRCYSCAAKNRWLLHPEKHKRKHYCISCAKEIKNFYAKRCKSCTMILHWKLGILKIRKGKNHPNYKDGKGNEPYSNEFTKKLKEQIRKRDKYICQNCRMIEKEHLNKYNCKLDIHHIDYNRKNCNKKNLISLCKKCNTIANKNRNYWIEFYNKIIKG